MPSSIEGIAGGLMGPAAPKDEGEAPVGVIAEGDGDTILGAPEGMGDIPA